MELQLAAVECLIETSDELASKDTGEHLGEKKEPIL